MYLSAREYVIVRHWRWLWVQMASIKKVDDSVVLISNPRLHNYHVYQQWPNLQC